MGEVVQWIHTPRVPLSVMLRMTDAQQQGIAHDHVRVRHVDLRPQHVSPVRELPGLHPSQQIEVLRDRAIPIRTVRSGRRDGPAVETNLVLRLRVHVRFAILHQQLGDLVEPAEVVAGVELSVPLEAEPAQVLLECLDVLDVLGERVGVVEAQIAASVEFLGDTEVQADGFDVADVRKAVRLGRKARRDRTAEPAGRHVFGNQLTDEVFPGRSSVRHESILGRKRH